MKFIYFPFFLMLSLAILTQMMAYGEFADGNGTVFGIDYDDPLAVNENISQMIDDEQTTFGIGEYDATLGFTLQDGFIAVLIGVAVVGIVAGISVLGSGLSEFSVKVIYRTILFAGLWGLVSAFGIEAFDSFPMGFGWLLYFVLTVIYGFGAMDYLAEGSAGGRG